MFNVSADSVQRHWQRHCPDSVKHAHRVKWAAPKADIDKLTMAEADVLVYQQRLRADLLTLFEAAKADAHYASVAAISRELRGVLELTSKITGELTQNAKKSTIVNVALDPEFLAFRAKLLEFLRKHPAAFADVLAELRKVDDKAAAAMGPSPPMIRRSTERVGTSEWVWICIAFLGSRRGKYSSPIAPCKDHTLDREAGLLCMSQSSSRLRSVKKRGSFRGGSASISLYAMHIYRNASAEWLVQSWRGLSRKVFSFSS